ncbi:hypothetical protein HY500_00460 [Candidatus Woesearchaeota archaeon]|nr:hypothetical protein [Candidatus Woesearchaeota archaeon]
MKLLHKLLLLCSLLLVFFLVYSPHFSYKYPLHADEYQHIGKAIGFLESKNLNFNPYLPDQPYHPNLEPGFTIFLAILLSIPINPMFYYQILPALFAVLASFILFRLMYHITKNFYISILSILFFASLKSNVNLTGLWFFTPLTLAIPIFFLTLLLFLKWQDEKKSFLLPLLTFTMLFFIHPLSAILIYLLLSLLLFINKDLKKVLFSLLIPVILTAILLLLSFKESSNVFSLVLDWLIVEKGWGSIELVYFLPSFYNIIPFLLALIGIYPSLKDKKLRLFVMGLLLTTSLIFLFNNLKFSIIFPYQRIIYYSLIIMVPLSAVGLFFILEPVKKYKIVIITLLILVSFSAFYNYYDQKDQPLYHVIDDKDYAALLFLKQFPQSTIIVPLQQSSAVYPITKHKVIGMTQSALLGGNWNKVKEFYETNCANKESIMKVYKIKYVFSKNKLDCKFLEEIYSKGNYIYKPNISF